MAQSTAPEKTGASGAYYAIPPAPARLISPAGYVALAALLLVTLVIVLKVAAAFQESSSAASFQEGYEEVDLGQLTRELAPEPGALLRDTFMLKVVLVLNPKVRDVLALKTQVERRRNLLRDIVWSEIILPKNDADFRKPAQLEALKAEIRQRLNQELGGTKDGQEMIARVIFPERKLPERR